MNIEIIKPLLTGSRCCLSSLNEDFTSCLSLLKNLWCDKKTLSTIDEIKMLFGQSLKMGCHGACENCSYTVLEMFKRLDNIGVEQIYFDLLIGRQKFKKIFQAEKTAKRKSIIRKKC